MSTELTVKEPRTVKDYLALPAYKDRFTEVLNKRAPQFMAAITAVSQMPTLKDAEPRSVIAAAMVAATLDLPVNPTLGQAHIVAYKDRTGEGIAQFQIGYRGLIQLALRSGQYKRLNAGPVNAEVFSGYDAVGEPSLDWTKFDPAKEIGGYFCAFELVNGFTKVVYWTKAQCEAHGKRFSKAYQKGYQSSPWFSDFDGMATKTVIKNALTKWGMLSVEMQNAVVHDQGAQTDVDREVKYVDAEERTVTEDAAARPAPPPRAAKGAAAVKENVAKEVIAEVEPVADKPVAPPQPVPDKPVTTPATQPQVPEKPVQSFADAAAATAEGPRTRLNPGEKMTAIVDIAVLKPMKKQGRRKGSDVVEPVPVVYAETTGADYAGQIVHPEGAREENGEVIALPPWAVGAHLRVELVGGKSPMAVVESVQVEEVF